MLAQPHNDLERNRQIVSEGEFKTIHAKIPPDSDFSGLADQHFLLAQNADKIGLKIVPPGSAKPAIFIARPDVIEDVLRDPISFGLQNYDEAFYRKRRNTEFENLTFFLSENQRMYELKRALVREIFGHSSHSAAIDDLGVAKTAQRIAAEIVADLYVKSGRKKRFDIFRDFGDIVTYRVNCEIFGLGGYRRFGFPVRALRVFRALATRRGFGGTQDARDAQNIISACQLFFLQLFGNFRNRSSVKKWLGHRVAKTLQIESRRAIMSPDGTEKSVFLSRVMKAWVSLRENEEVDFTDEEIQTAIEEMLLEFVTTLVMIVKIGFTKVLKSVHETGYSFSDAIDAVNLPDVSAKPYGFINEALRKNSPTGIVFRRAKRDVLLGSEIVKSGEDLILLISKASMYKGTFKNPSELNPSRSTAHYLHFGPYEGVHACLGQNWAKEIIRQMLVSLESLEGLAFSKKNWGKPREFAKGQIDSWIVQFND